MSDGNQPPCVFRVFIVASNEFVAQDAADIVGGVVGNGQIGTYSHPDQVLGDLDIAAPGARDLALVIGPRGQMSKTGLADALLRRDGTMVVLGDDPSDQAALGCRVIHGSLPFSSESLEDLVREAMA